MVMNDELEDNCTDKVGSGLFCICTDYAQGITIVDEDGLRRVLRATFTGNISEYGDE